MWAAEEWGQTGVSLRILCPPPSAPRGVWLPGSPGVTALSGAAAEKQQKGEANEPQLPARTPGSRGAGRRGAAAAGTITRTSVARTGGPLRPRCRSPPRRHPQLRNNSCRERVRLRASEGQGRRSAPTAGLQRELRRPGTSRSFACIRAPCRRTGLPWILAAGRGNPQHRSPGRTSPKETAPEPEGKMHSGAFGGGCLSPRERAVAGDGLSPFISSISGARGAGKKYPLQVTRGGGGGCGRRSCSISKFQAGHYSSHSPPTFPSSLKISNWAKEMGAPLRGMSGPSTLLGERPVTPPHEVAKVSSGTGGSPLGLSRKRRRTWTTKQPPARLQLPETSRPGERGGPRPSETPPDSGAICEGSSGDPLLSVACYFRILPLFQRQS